MSSFCTGCAILLGFEPDFVDRDKKAMSDLGVHRIVLCEECGPITVDWMGWCMREDCDGTRQHGHRTEGGARVLLQHARWLERTTGPLGVLWRLRDTLLGSPYNPGLVHRWRWRYHDIRDRIRSRLSGEPADGLTYFADWEPSANPDVVAEKSAAARVEAARRTPRGAAEAGFPREKDE